VGLVGFLEPVETQHILDLSETETKNEYKPGNAHRSRSY